MSEEAVTGSDLVAHQLKVETRTANGIHGLIVGSASLLH